VTFVVPFAFSPLWSRVYPVDYFAVAALVQTIPGLFAGWSTLAMHNAVHSPKSEDAAMRLAQVGLLGVVALGAVVAVACLAVAPQVARFLGGGSDLAPWLWAAPLLLVASGGALVADQMMARRGQYEAMAKCMVFQALSGPLVPAWGASAPERANFIVLGLVIVNVLGLALRLSYSRLLHDLARARWGAGHLREEFGRHLNFPRDVLPGNVLTAFAAQLPQVVLARSFGTETVGHYARATTLLTLPSVVFGNAFATVFSREAGSAYRDRGDCRPEFVRTLGRLLLVLGPCYAVLAVASPWLYPWFYGPSWAEAGRLAQPMAVLLFFSAVSAPLSAVLYFGRNTKWDLLWQAVRVPIVLGALMGGAVVGGVLGALWSLAAANALLYLAYLGLSYRLAVSPDARRTPQFSP
jgi:O-antigen/teichoic acid export membrane protein